MNFQRICYKNCRVAFRLVLQFTANHLGSRKSANINSHRLLVFAPTVFLFWSCNSVWVIYTWLTKSVFTAYIGLSLGTSHLLGGGGGRLYSGGGVRIFFGDVLGGLKIKWPMGRGVHVFRQVFGGSDVFHWSFFSLKVIASGGAKPPQTPLYPSSMFIFSYANTKLQRWQHNNSDLLSRDKSAKFHSFGIKNNDYMHILYSNPVG